MFGVDLHTVVALAAAQGVLYLYGAGLRRPFGSLITVESLPCIIRFSTWPVVIADWAFLIFMAVIWGWLLVHGPLLFVIIAGFLLCFPAHWLMHKITIIPSAFIALALALLAVLAIALKTLGA